ncbi:MAG TPA: hypothetical protein VFP86_02680, partial [bacterium]|nr:hypothetical protein [bacterium]
HLDAPLVVVEIRDDSNTAMAIQWTLKRHTLEMFERLFSGMTDQERVTYGADEVLRSCRTKLALASLVSLDPARSIGEIATALPPALAKGLPVLLKVVPAGMIRVSAGGVWRLRQRLAFSRLRDPSIERAWAQIHAPRG